MILYGNKGGYIMDNNSKINTITNKYTSHAFYITSLVTFFLMIYSHKNNVSIGYDICFLIGFLSGIYYIILRSMIKNLVAKYNYIYNVLFSVLIVMITLQNNSSIPDKKSYYYLKLISAGVFGITSIIMYIINKFLRDNKT